MGRSKRILIIYIFFFLGRLLFSCRGCNNTPVLFNLDKAVLTNIENSGEWAGNSISDTMFSKAVAFKIAIGSIESANNLAYYSPLNGLGFVKAYSMEECPTYYKPNQDIKDIKISSVFNISSTIPANTELSEDNIVYALSGWVSINNMYISKEMLLSKINSDIVYDIPEISFLFFLKDKVENNTAQFNIRVELSDRRFISAQTRIITIYQL